MAIPLLLSPLPISHGEASIRGASEWGGCPWYKEGIADTAQRGGFKALIIDIKVIVGKIE